MIESKPLDTNSCIRSAAIGIPALKLTKELCDQILAWEVPNWKNWTGEYSKWASHDYYFLDERNPNIPFMRELLKQIEPVTRGYTFGNVRLTRYKVGDYIGIHQDVGDMERKLTCVIQLSDPKDYEGGELIVEGVEACKEQGAILTHDPLKDWHEVKPVTKGTRYTLVIWLK